MFAKLDAASGEHADQMIELFRLKHVRSYTPERCPRPAEAIDIAMAFMPAPRPCCWTSRARASTESRRPIARAPGRAQQSQGGSFVVIEHNMDFIMRLCPHVICMVEGKVLAEGPPQEVQANRQVLEAYLGN
jgi:branched-chain amino acid transport system ATP-binding protein